jgi:hypothetical protein
MGGDVGRRVPLVSGPNDDSGDSTSVGTPRFAGRFVLLPSSSSTLTAVSACVAVDDSGDAVIGADRRHRTALR